MEDYGVGSSECELCPIGTYNPGPGDSSSDTHSSSAHGGSVGIAAIAVSSQQQLSAADYPYKKHRRRPTATPCRSCGATNPRGAFITQDYGATRADQCVCAPGYGGVACEPCPMGTYSEGGKDAACHSCPGGGAGYTTLEGAATSIAACVCLAGYGMTDQGVCKLCPPDTFGAGGSKQACQPCE
jgi:hypothetical protein